MAVSLLDYGAGNVRSVRNALRFLGCDVRDITTADEIEAASVVVFPGVGSFGSAMQTLRDRNLVDTLRAYIQAGRPFFGVCLGMQTLFHGSAESPGVEGLGILPGTVEDFRGQIKVQVPVPHIGWNGIRVNGANPAASFFDPTARVYFVHSFCVPLSQELGPDVATSTTYGETEYVSAVARGNLVATQFHPEKSGGAGLEILRRFLATHLPGGSAVPRAMASVPTSPEAHVDKASTVLAKRIIACLDVRSNDAGDLVVTKGDQYDVRETSEGGSGRGAVRNLGKPVALAERYYRDGADEVVFLNITSFRQDVLDDQPMLQVLERASENIFVPLTVGGGIRSYTDATGREWSALEVASRYFRAGADKVSLGTDAVRAAEALRAGTHESGTSAIEQISGVYGRQAVVISIDPRRVYVSDPAEAPGHTVVEAPVPSPDGKNLCWYQATVKGGREGRDIDALAVAQECERLGAGEIMLNCIDADGQGRGYEIPLLRAVANAVSIPVIASSGAGSPSHFHAVFRDTNVQAALAAGIFHRQEVDIQDVKEVLRREGHAVRVVQEATDAATPVSDAAAAAEAPAATAEN
uniref:Imidazole glycerol phosphate synthase hisHF n=1 Tax=Rhizochromulina marina TaxID=1034831 RepID=A0A7S2WS76_9STRA|mmetsp:Transcript_32694/g.94650  ORF Transcript_32694/g.94650 Transcript_32694/m.94650 type:complete len:582 (+) Transcript_32694:49-1794(+)